MNDDAVNAGCIAREIAWFGEVAQRRLRGGANEAESDSLAALPPPPLPESGSAYADVVQRLALDPRERLILILAYVPHVQPSALDPFLIQKPAMAARLPDGGLLPTGETALFLLCGDSLEARLRAHALLAPEHRFFTENVLRLEEALPASPLLITPEYVERLTTGRGDHSPPRPLTTDYEWSDLVLDPATRRECEEIVTRARHLDPALRILFHGPSGTGKTRTAALIGKATERPVYRMDLSSDLTALLDQAHRDWILFFDQTDPSERVANQQIAYLLQRVEDFPGIVILATNTPAHLDQAFARRFQFLVHFPLPSAEQRAQQREKTMPPISRVDPYKNFTFRVSLGDADVGGFQAMSAITKLSGLNKSTDVTLKRGIVAAPALQDWLNQVKRKRTVAIELRNQAQSVTARWLLRSARVIKHDADPLNAVGNDVVVETLVLSAERLEFLSPPS